MKSTMKRTKQTTVRTSTTAKADAAVAPTKHLTVAEVRALKIGTVLIAVEHTKEGMVTAGFKVKNVKPKSLLGDWIDVKTGRSITKALSLNGEVRIANNRVALRLAAPKEKKSLVRCESCDAGTVSQKRAVKKPADLGLKHGDKLVKGKVTVTVVKDGYRFKNKTYPHLRHVVVAVLGPGTHHSAASFFKLGGYSAGKSPFLQRAK